MAILCFDGNQNRLTIALIDAYNKNCRQYALKIVLLVFRQMVEMKEGEKKGTNIPGAAVACEHHTRHFTYFNSLKLHNNLRCNLTNEETELKKIKTQSHLFAPHPHIIFENDICGRVRACRSVFQKSSLAPLRGQHSNIMIQELNVLPRSQMVHLRSLSLCKEVVPERGEG